MTSSGSGIWFFKFTSVILHISKVVFNANLSCFSVPPFRINPRVCHATSAVTFIGNKLAMFIWLVVTASITLRSD